MYRPLQKICIDHSITDLLSNAEQISFLNGVVAALEIVKECLLRLCERSCNLLQADKIYEFLLKDLINQNTEFSLKLHCSLENRISQRRISEFSDLLKLLNNPFYKQDSILYFP